MSTSNSEQCISNKSVESVCQLFIIDFGPVSYRLQLRSVSCRESSAFVLSKIVEKLCALRNGCVEMFGFEVHFQEKNDIYRSHGPMQNSIKPSNIRFCRHITTAQRCAASINLHKFFIGNIHFLNCGGGGRNKEKTFNKIWNSVMFPNDHYFLFYLLTIGTSNSNACFSMEIHAFKRTFRIECWMLYIKWKWYVCHAIAITFSTFQRLNQFHTFGHMQINTTQ